MESAKSTNTDHGKTTGHTEARAMNAIDALSDGVIALLWRCLDGFDRWCGRRAAIRRLYGVSSITSYDLRGRRPEIGSAAFGCATVGRQTYAKH